MRIILIPVLVSLLSSIFCTPLLVKFFRSRGFGQEIRDDGPLTHMVKRGTPTMGGVAIVGSTVAGYVVAHVVTATRGGHGVTASGLLLLFLMVGLGLVGFMDDFIKVRHQRSLGLRARAKFGGQLLIGLVFAVLALQFRNPAGLTPASTHLSYVRDIAAFGVGSVGFVILAYVIVTATSNSTNLTDGLDGLLAGSAAMVFAAYTFITLQQSRYTCVRRPTTGCYEVRDPMDLAIVAVAALGACFGFLWWNAAPAHLFMGDTGSLALGGLIAAIAILSTPNYCSWSWLASTLSSPCPASCRSAGSNSPARAPGPGEGRFGCHRCTTTLRCRAGTRSPSLSGSGSSPACPSPSWACSTQNSSATATSNLPPSSLTVPLRKPGGPSQRQGSGRRPQLRAIPCLVHARIGRGRRRVGVGQLVEILVGLLSGLTDLVVILAAGLGVGRLRRLLDPLLDLVLVAGGLGLRLGGQPPGCI